MKNLNDGMSLKKQISLFIDNELPVEIEDGLRQRLSQDPKISRMVQKEQDFREYIKNTVKRPTVSPNMVQQLKDRIRE